MGDSRLQGLGKNNIGSIATSRGVTINHDTATGTYGIIELADVSANTPAFVEVFVNIATVFDADGCSLLVQSYDGSNATDIVASGDVTEGNLGTTVRYSVQTANNKIRVNWTKGTSNSTGKAYIFVRVSGKGTGKYLDSLSA